MNDGAPVAPALEPFFLETEGGPRFCIARCAGQSTTGASGILFVPPFAEEMNKSRRMVALQSRALAANGFTVLELDPFGCGDSAGELRDMTWDRWYDDVAAGHAWLVSRGCSAVALWGLRLGALIALDAARRRRLDVSRFLLWQPLLDGEQLLRQFLRLHVAGEMLAAGSPGAGVDQLQAALAAGQAIEVAGYDLSPELARGLRSLKLVDLAPSVPVTWLEVAAQEGADLSPAARRAADLWQSRGVPLSTRCVAGPSFWNTLVVTEAPDLVPATVAAMREP